MTKFTATAPDGTILKRTSKTRTYTHVIVARNCIVRALRRIEDQVEADGSEGNYGFLAKRAAMKAGETYSYKYPSGRIYTEALTQDEIDSAAKKLMGATTREEYMAKRRAFYEANVEQQSRDGHFAEWVAVSWVGRPDLVADRIAYAEKFMTDVKALPVEAK